MPLEYNILLNASSPTLLVKPVGRAHFAVVDGLDPYTLYEIRIQACQNGKVILKDTSATGIEWKGIEHFQIDSTQQNR